MTKSIIIFFTLLCLLSSCNNTDSKTQKENATKEFIKELNVLDKLIGTWKNEDGISYEKWIKNPDGSYQSAGYQIKDADTIFTESVKVYEKDGNWISENTVKGQNENMAIKFSITLSENELHFNNPEHDFPTDIHYQLEDDNTIKAYIAGPNQSGGRDTIPFNFTRAIQ